jgi:hypothetical protein
MSAETNGSVCHIDGIVPIILEVLNEEELFSQIVRITLITQYFGSSMIVAILPYFLAHKKHCDFFIRNFRKKKYNNDECILILVIYWKKTGLLHTKISNHNIIYSS